MVDEDRLPRETEDGTGTAASAGASGVGALLRASRLRVGEDLQDVAQMLRIRYPYLQAIEEGNFEELPGPAYASGFVRAYADHLGLDAEEVVRRYKDETSNRSRGGELYVLSPIPESGVPRGALMLLGILLAILAYGGWYLSTANEDLLTNLVPPVPERLSSLLPESASPPAGEPTAEQVTSATPSPAPAPEVVAATPDAVAGEEAESQDQDGSVDVGEAADSQDEGEAPAAATASAPAIPEPDRDAPTEDASTPAVAEEASPVGPAAVAEDAVTEDPDVTPPPTEAVAVAPAPQAAPAATREPPAQESPVATPMPKPTPKPEPQTATPPDPTPTPAPVPAAKGHIVVRARLDSWVQVRDTSNDSLLMTRLLKAGEEYVVPDQKGLKLLTGNAGALDVLVDGQKVPALGPIGAVRRNIALDAALLRAGTATGQ